MSLSIIFLICSLFLYPSFLDFGTGQKKFFFSNYSILLHLLACLMYLLVPIFKWFPLKLQNASFLYVECYFLEDQDNLPSLKSVLRFLISGNYIASKDKVWVELEYKISENCRNIESWHLLKGSYPGMLKKLGTRLKTKEVSFRGEGRYCLPTKKRIKSYLGLLPI